MESDERKRVRTLPCACVGVLFLVQFFLWYIPIESVRIKRVEFRENLSAFFPQGQSKNVCNNKVSVLSVCP